MTYLLDSNVIIDYVGKKLIVQQAAFVVKIPVYISVITRIELIGRFNATYTNN